jgi:hypothetical protein
MSCALVLLSSRQLLISRGDPHSTPPVLMPGRPSPRDLLLEVDTPRRQLCIHAYHGLVVCAIAVRDYFVRWQPLPSLPRLLASPPTYPPGYLFKPPSGSSSTPFHHSSTVDAVSSTWTHLVESASTHRLSGLDVVGERFLSYSSRVSVFHCHLALVTTTPLVLVQTIGSHRSEVRTLLCRFSNARRSSRCLHPTAKTLMRTHQSI